MQNFFLGIKGQKSALNILSELHSKDRVPHALLFSGIEGCGKFNVAIEFLKLLNNNSESESLKRIEKLAEPYVKLIIPLPRGKSETGSDLPTAKLSPDILDELHTQINKKSINPFHKIEIKNANNIKISSIREINKLISLNFDEIPYRGIIISDAHKMTTEAQNAFLKNLEEPPSGVIYMLLTDSTENLLTTIKSRCWEINFNPLKGEEIASIIQDNYNFEIEMFNKVLPFAHGSVTRALYLYENNLETYLHKTILILRYSLARKYFTARQEFNDIVNGNSVVSYQIVLDLLISWFTDTLKQNQKLDILDFIDYKETLEKFNSRFKNVELNKLITKLVEFRNAPTKNVSLNLLVMNVIFEIASIGMKVNDRKVPS